MKIFIDTSPFIYLVENHPDYIKGVRRFFVEVISNEYELVTSVITIMEFGVVPQKKGQTELLVEFENLLEMMSVSIGNIDRAIAERAYRLRAKYDFLKGMDALQLAVAIESKSDQFLSNDRKLKRITEIPIILVDSL